MKHIRSCVFADNFSLSGSIMFHVRRRPADYHPRKRKKKPQQKWQRSDLDGRYDDCLPFFLELNPGMSKAPRATGVSVSFDYSVLIR